MSHAATTHEVYCTSLHSHSAIHSPGSFHFSTILPSAVSHDKKPPSWYLFPPWDCGWGHLEPRKRSAVTFATWKQNKRVSLSCGMFSIISLFPCKCTCLDGSQSTCDVRQLGVVNAAAVLRQHLYRLTQHVSLLRSARGQDGTDGGGHSSSVSWPHSAETNSSPMEIRTPEFSTKGWKRHRFTLRPLTWAASY